MSRTPTILVVGSINVDLVCRLARMPESAETVFGEDYAYIAGGKGANQAVAAARLGANVRFVGCVGADAHGENVLAGLSRERVDTAHIARDASRPTGLAVIPVDASGQNRIIVFPGANMGIDMQSVRAAMREDIDAVMLQLEIPIDVIYGTCALAREKGIHVVLDAGPARALDFERLRPVEIISPNESEMFALTGIMPEDEISALAACERLLELARARYVLLKLGARGALLYGAEGAQWFPAYTGIPVVDTTAAGDSFTAAFALGLCEHGQIPRAIRYANAVGALCVTRMGAQPSLPTSDEVRAFIAERGLL